MFSVAVILKSGEVKGKSVTSKEEAEQYILELAEREGIKQGRIRNTATGEEEAINFE
jgi:hypothetical protein